MHTSAGVSMLHHQIHHLARAARHAGQFYQYARDIVDVGLLRLQQTPAKLREISPGTNRPPLLLHYHIFKNAGTSFEATLEENFRAAFHRFDGKSSEQVLSGRDVERFVLRVPDAKVISSHQATLPVPRIPGRQVLTSILIRDPISRIRSVYAFERRQNTTNLGARKAKELDFKGYVEWRLATSPAALCNYQVHFCSRTKSNIPHGDDEDRLKTAIRHLDQVDLVGTVDRYDEWLALAQAILAKSFPDIALESSRQNVSPGYPATKATIVDDLIEDLGLPLAEKLVAANELDMRLHQVADSLLTRRLGERGVKLTLRAAYASVRPDFLRRAKPVAKVAEAAGV